MAFSLVDTEPCFFPNGSGPVYEYEGSIASVDGDVTIRTAPSDKRIWVVGILQAEATAATLTLKSGSSKTKVIELAANQAIYDKTSLGYIFSVKAGEAFTVASSASVGSLTLRLLVAASFHIK